jgi:hypothetical protein
MQFSFFGHFQSTQSSRSRMNAKKNILKRAEELSLEDRDEAKRPRSPEGPPPPPPTLQREKAWVASVSTEIYGATYPLVTGYNFVMQPYKTINPNLDIVPIGIQHGQGGRTWAFTITSPPCTATFIQSKYDGAHSRARLAPNAPDGINVEYPAQFIEFIDHLDQICNRLKDMLEKDKYTVDTWSSPFIEEDGNLQGVYVKVKNPTVRSLLTQNGVNLKCTIKLTCAYFTRDRCGLSFELVAAYNS